MIHEGRNRIVRRLLDRDRAPGPAADPDRDRPGRGSATCRQGHAARADHSTRSDRCSTPPACRLDSAHQLVVTRRRNRVRSRRARSHPADRGHPRGDARAGRRDGHRGDVGQRPGRRRLHLGDLHRDLRPGRRVPGVRRPPAGLRGDPAAVRPRAGDRGLDAAGGADDGARRDRPCPQPRSPTSTCTARLRCAPT